MKDSLSTLRESVKKFPKSPGVYLMKDFDGVIIYVGKAKELRARVRSYFSSGDGRLQIEYLLKRVSTIDTIITSSEEEALLLERDLIHKHKPRYNIRLKDDRAYISVKINRNNPWPRLETVRQVIPDGAEYYGPFTNSAQLRDVLHVIKKVIPLRTCADSVLRNRVRPCLEYEMKNCAAPCCLSVDGLQYEEWLRQAIQILEGNIEGTLRSLERNMEEASNNLRYEEAAAIRDRITTLENYKEKGSEGITYSFTCDCFALYREDSLAIVSLLKARDGALSEVESFPFTDVFVEDAEILESAIIQYYSSGREIPSEVVVPVSLPSQEAVGSVLSKDKGNIVNIESPNQGPKHRLLRICEINARQQFAVKFFSEARYDAVAVELQAFCRLSQAPRRIECVDISNLQGSNIVGASTCFVDGVPDKQGYRRYNISFQDKPNDFEAIYEVVKRRLSKSPLPELLIIDGGREQLKRALEARQELGVSLDIISLAKFRSGESSEPDGASAKPERIFIEGASDALPLNPEAPLTHFLERVRDETHRFVITFHRNKRAKSAFKSVLDDIPGVGVDRRVRLLKAFGSIEAIGEASVEEVARLGKMPLSLAKRINEHIRGKN